MTTDYEAVAKIVGSKEHNNTNVSTDYEMIVNRIKSSKKNGAIDVKELLDIIMELKGSKDSIKEIMTVLHDLEVVREVMKTDGVVEWVEIEVNVCE